MPTERVLVEIITAANLAGVEEAQAGLLKLNIATAALAIGLGIAIKIGKDALDNYKSQSEAMAGLAQAVDASHRTLRGYNEAIRDFIKTNAAFISNQYDVIAAFAALVRAGNKEKDAVRELNIALDMSVAKHEDVSVAAGTVEKVLKGNSRALREVGVSTKQYNDIMKSHHTEAWKMNAILTIMEQKYRGMRTTIDETQQSHDKLTIAWQDFTTRLGPAMAYTLTLITDDLVLFVDTLSKLYDWLARLKGPTMGSNFNSRGQAIAPPIGGGAGRIGMGGTHGGPGGVIYGARTPNVFYINGVFMDHGPSIDRLTNEIVRRLAMAPGT